MTFPLTGFVSKHIYAPAMVAFGRSGGGGAGTTVVQSAPPRIFEDRAVLGSASVESAIQAVNLNGHAAAGDGGAALYVRVDAEPTHAGKVQSNDGQWWELRADVVTPQQFGAIGDGTSDDTAAFQAALAYGSKVFVPRGTYRITETLVMASGQCLGGEGRGSRIEVAADVVAVSLQQYSGIEGLEFEAVAPSTSNMIEVGDDATRSGARSTLVNLHIINAGNDAIQIRDGNLGTIRDVACLGSARDGINFITETPDNNAWKLEGFLDLRSNGRDGLHFAQGASEADPHAPKSNSADLVVAQQNGRYGVYVGTRSNILRIYSEANDADEVFFDTYAFGNLVETVEGGVGTDNGSFNHIVSHNHQTQYRRAFENKVLLAAGPGNGLRFTNGDGTPGELDFEKTAARTYTLRAGSSSATQNLFLRNAVDTFRLDLNVDGRVLPVEDGQYDLGRTAIRWRDLVLSGGVFLGGTGTQHRLSVYEEGTFSPTLTTSGNDFQNVGYDAVTSGEYTKIGNRVDFVLFLRTDSVTIAAASGNVRIGGLPFRAKNNGLSAPVNVGEASDWGGNTPIAAQVEANDFVIDLFKRSNAGDAPVNLLTTDIGTTPDDNLIRVAGTYFTD